MDLLEVNDSWVISLYEYDTDDYMMLKLSDRDDVIKYINNRSPIDASGNEIRSIEHVIQYKIRDKE